MRRGGMCGMALVNLLVALSVLSTVLAVARPAAFSLYVRTAVEYEAMRLIGELRRVQALSRTTAMPLYMLQGRPSWERVPRLRIHTESYELNRPFAGDVRVYRPLPLVRFYQTTMEDTPVVFDRNGDIAQAWSSNMTIRVYVEGHMKDAVYVVIDRAARIRLQRGDGNASDEGG